MRLRRIQIEVSIACCVILANRQNLLKIEKDQKICKLSMTEIKKNRNKSQSVKLCSKCDNYNNKESNYRERNNLEKTRK